MFPFIITQQRALGKINNVESVILIEEIEKELIRLEVNMIECSEESIHFTNKFFSGHGRNHLMNSVSKGYFKIDKRSDRIVYNYSIIRIFYSIAAISIILAFASRDISFALGAFIWFSTLCCFVTFARHYFFMNRIKKMLLKFDTGSHPRQ